MGDGGLGPTLGATHGLRESKDNKKLMSILLDSTTRVIVQGITGREGAYHTRNMQAAGTKIVGGVTPGKGGQTAENVPVFDTVAQAKAATDANASCIFVP